MDRVTIRQATAADTERIAQIMAGEPAGDIVALAGNESNARRIWTAMISMPGSPIGWEVTRLAEVNGEVVGVLQSGDHEGSIKITPRLALFVIWVVKPWGLPRGIRSLKAQDRVRPAPIPGSYRVQELHVDPKRRNEGIGGAMLDFAEAEARAAGYTQMALTTTTSNPARHLYERHGFRIVETKTDPEYERATGVSGRYRMVKDLG